MKFTFSDSVPQVSEQVPAGELWVRPSALPDGARPALTRLALEHGPEAFAVGPGGIGAVKQVVVKADPTLDDVLAGAVLIRQLAGETFPRQARLAHYVEQLAHGFHPAERVPPEDLLEGHFTHYRFEAGDPLTDPNRAARFLSDWARMEPVLLDALRRDRDPFRRSLLDDRPEFEPERRQLLNDRAVYERDFQRGERLRVRLPGEAELVPALRLDEPKSTMFKVWARTDPAAAVAGGDGRGYKFLAVKWATMGWFFSVDPLDRYRIGSLAAALEAEERKKSPGRDGSDPWFDGMRFGYTIVCQPRGGTRLSDDEVWAVVKRWGHARPWPRKRPWRVAAATVLAAVALSFAAWWSPPPPPPTAPPPVENAELIALKTEIARHLGELKKEKKPLTRTRSRDFLPLGDVPTGTRHALPLKGTFRRDALRLYATTSCVERPPILVWTWDAPEGRKTQATIWKKSANDEDNPGRCWETEPIRAVVGNPSIDAQVFAVPGTGAKEFDLMLHWELNRYELHLHALCVGVSRSDLLDDLEAARNDAKSLVQGFEAQKGNGLFTEVFARPLFDPKWDELLEALRVFAVLINAEAERQPEVKRLVVVTFTGHGVRGAKQGFGFVPRNYDGTEWSLVTWPDVARELEVVKHPTVLLLDCCYSGSVALQVPSAGEGNAPVHSKSTDPLQRTVEEYGNVRSGLFVLASCGPDEKARAGQQNGLMAAEVLRVLKGQALQQNGADGQNGVPIGQNGMVSLRDLSNHLCDVIKVKALPHVQEVRAGFPPGAQVEKVPFAYTPPKKN
jgi:hypothetical protein